MHSGQEYALVSGWGDTDLERDEVNPDTGEIEKITTPPEFLSMGWMVLVPTFNNKSDWLGDIIVVKYVAKGAQTCAVRLKHFKMTIYNY